MLTAAIIFINLAFICYTTGVWKQRLTKRADGINLIFFWAGLVFDTVGTKLMFIISSKEARNIHGEIGILAIILMLFHAAWASFVYIKKDEKALKHFEKFSVGVWVIWMAAYLLGIFITHK